MPSRHRQNKTNVNLDIFLAKKNRFSGPPAFIELGFIVSRARARLVPSMMRDPRDRSIAALNDP